MRAVDRKKLILLIAGAILGVALVVVVVMLVVKSVSKLGENERKELDYFSSHALVYLDEYDAEPGNSNPDETAKLIAYVVAYNYGENNKTETTLDEARQIAKDVFDVDLDLSKVQGSVMYSYVGDKQIWFEQSCNCLKLDRNTIDEKSVARIPIWLYQEQNARSFGGKITVRYKKYKIANPYNILNYAAEKQISIPGLTEYLEGHGSYAELERAVANEDIDTVGEFVKDLRIIYKERDGKLYIEKIE